jgi:hypothetical protein
MFYLRPECCSIRTVLLKLVATWRVLYEVATCTPPQNSGQDFAPSQVENVAMRRF